MKKESMKLIFVIAAAIIFNVIFWQEKAGINAAIFDFFILGTLFYLYPKALGNSACTTLAFGNLLAATMIVFHNTFLSKFACTVTLLLFISFAQYIHKSVWYAGGSVFLNYLFVVPNLFKQFRGLSKPTITTNGFGKIFRMLIIPAFILFIFIIIYSNANSMFSQLTSDIAEYLQESFINLFGWFSVQRFLFFLFGILISAGAILKSRFNYFSEQDVKQENILARKKNAFRKWTESSLSDILSLIIGKRAKGILALKNEYIIGFVSLVLLNILLLVINVIDIKYVWLGFSFSTDINLSEYVHEGAGMLIFSIILAMLLVLFFL